MEKKWRNFAESDKRPSSQEGYRILEEIVARHKLDYVARAFRVQPSTVTRWFGVSTDLFTRMRNFLRGLVEDGDADLAVRLTQLWCSAVGRESIPEPAKKLSLATLLQALAADGKESAEVQIAISHMVSDQVADLDEIEAALIEVGEQIEAANRMRGQLEFLAATARDQGGRVVLTLDFLRRSILGATT